MSSVLAPYVSRQKEDGAPARGPGTKLFRLVRFLLLLVVALAFLRGVVMILRKAIAGWRNPSEAQRAQAGGSGVSRELKRDPVCGTYIPADTAVKRIVAGQTVHFCSQNCSEKYKIEA